MAGLRGANANDADCADGIIGMNGGLDAVAERTIRDGRRPNSRRAVGTPDVVVVQTTGFAALPEQLRLFALLVVNEIE